MSSKLKVNLKNLEYNIQNIRKKLLKDQELLVMVKADAYGAGLIQVSRFLSEIGVGHLGVAYLKEARQVIEEKINADVTVFSGILKNEVEEAVELGAIYSVSDIEILKLLSEEALRKNKNVRVQLKIDTGMTRLGIDVPNIVNFMEEVKILPNIMIEGIYTHLSCADTNENFTKEQMQIFDNCVDLIKKMGINPKYIHVCNSAGFLLYNSNKYNMVRIGICSYGYFPDETLKKKTDILLKGIFRLETNICHIREVNPGRGVSYSATYTTNEPKKIGVVQIGYADGLTRTLSNNYELTVSNKKCKILGNICMDTCMIDLTGVDAKLGDVVTVFDFEDDNVDRIAKLTNTINYEIITNIGKRVDKEYITK